MEVDSQIIVEFLESLFMNLGHISVTLMQSTLCLHTMFPHFHNATIDVHKDKKELD